MKLVVSFINFLSGEFQRLFRRSASLSTSIQQSRRPQSPLSLLSETLLTHELISWPELVHDSSINQDQDDGAKVGVLCERVISRLPAEHQVTQDGWFAQRVKNALVEMMNCAAWRRELEEVAKIGVSMQRPEVHRAMNELAAIAQTRPIKSPNETPSFADCCARLGFSSAVDPDRDFRGLGCLGLQHLLYLVRNHRRRAIEIVELGREDSPFYLPFIPTSLNVSLWVLELGRSCELDAFRSENDVWSTVDIHGCIFVFALLEFVRHWKLYRPRDLGAFGEVAASFRPKLLDALRQLWHGKGEAMHGCSWDMTDRTSLDGASLCVRLHLWVEGDVPHKKFGDKGPGIISCALA